jgi:phosphatidylglycerol:prolipoprotein diacylglycerol transferase
MSLLGGLSSWTLCAVLGTTLAVGLGVFLGRRDVSALSRTVWLELVAAVVGGGWLFAKIGPVVCYAEGHALEGGDLAHGVLALLRADPWHWARLQDPGFVQLTGIAGAVGLGVVYLRRHGYGSFIAPLLDAAVVAIAVGIALGRVGCFLAGCCYGAPTDVAWAVHFPAGHETGGAGVHPTQLYDAAAAILAIVLWRVARRPSAWPGAAALVGSVWLLSSRIATEAMRGDVDRGHLGPISTSQALATIGLIAIVFAWRRHHSALTPRLAERSGVKSLSPQRQARG